MSFALLASVPIISAAAATGGDRDEKACAAYDLHLVTLIEDHGRFGDTDPQLVADASMRMIDARLACRLGNTGSAINLYDAISLDPVRIDPLHRVLLR